jgi:hypothetical protein
VRPGTALEFMNLQVHGKCNPAQFKIIKPTSCKSATGKAAAASNAQTNEVRDDVSLRCKETILLSGFCTGFCLALNSNTLQLKDCST